MASEIPTSNPRVILGLMTFGPPGAESKGARITSLREYEDCLDYLQQCGYFEIDTARVYIDGEQEAFTREAKWKERGLKLATKCFPTEPGMHKKDRLKAILDKSLQELGTDCVDIFYLHAPDRTVPFLETLEACNELFEEGKFRQLGLSNYSAWEVAEIYNVAEAHAWVKPTTYQAMYNAITRTIDEELIPCCRKYGIDIVVYNPLAGGILSGKYKSNEVPNEGRYSDAVAGEGKMYRERYFRNASFDALRLIEPVVLKHNLSLIEVALRWCVHHSKLKVADGNDGVIIGVSSVGQLKDNLQHLKKGPLPDEIVQVLDDAWFTITKATAPLYWR
ncbi:hypothetical protein H2200_010283 [Cladophialophora chaetospira]|uniref:NADP-dependent oxidoreductase domain-containing protein n=1 Tax=Cladophialophora chaetospira TaxID=386627 RepID=A0AA39CE49_9EURO|nr:hypothetical protein H2200_010283 [Cladophialophora chaetospira]